MIFIREYHDFYPKGDTLLSADVFEIFRKKMFRHLSTRSCKIYFSSKIIMASSFQKTELKLELSTGFEIPSMVEKGIMGEYVTLLIDIS